MLAMAYDSPDRDPEIRRRAAWLLGMLALVAALLVLIMVVFLDGGGDGDGEVADPTAVPPAPASTTAPRSPSDSSSTSDESESPTSSSGTAGGTTGATSSGPAPGGDVSCPSDELCGLDSDVGNAVEAVNAYRVDEGEQAVPGKVSDEARKCALSNGSSCSGSYATTQIPLTDGKADGVAAVERVRTRGKLLQDMKSFSVGWAYDPGAKTLYFAVIRQD